MFRKPSFKKIIDNIYEACEYRKLSKSFKLEKLISHFIENTFNAFPIHLQAKSILPR